MRSRTPSPGASATNSSRRSLPSAAEAKKDARGALRSVVVVLLVRLVFVLVLVVAPILLVQDVARITLEALGHGGAVVELQEVAEAHLCGVVDDELAVLQAHRGDLLGLVALGLLLVHLHRLAQRDLHAVGHREALVLPVGATLAHGHGGVGACHGGLQISCHSRLEGLADGHLRQEEVLGLVAAGTAVTHALRSHVCEVDALPEGVARDGCLGRGDAETLGQNPDEVGGRRPMPEQPVAAQLLTLGVHSRRLAAALQPRSGPPCRSFCPPATRAWRRPRRQLQPQPWLSQPRSPQSAQTT
mmetsp:Transcript_58353/g.182983  ORF Transcript_58353/g.182983 Transcript_58353/m.182983 type:complete len:301 (+) Transcript_58353:171-1073(+)